MAKKQIRNYFGLILIPILFLIGCFSNNEKAGTKTTGETAHSSSVCTKPALSQNSDRSQSKIDSFLVTARTVGIFKQGMTIGDAIRIVPGTRIKKKIGYGEFKSDTYDDYEIYDDDTKHLLTLTPLIQNDLTSPINRVFIVDNRFTTEFGISLKSTYAELVESFTVSRYSPDIEHIVLSVEQLGAWFGIKKTELEQNWWDAKTQKIDKSKIPSNSRIDTFVIWWD